jgi:hypothetical protein
MFMRHSIIKLTLPNKGECSCHLITLKIIFIFRGNYLFPPWTTKKCAMPPWPTNSTKIEHSTTKDNPFPPFCQSKRLKQTVNGSSDHHTPFYLNFLPLFSPMNYHHLPTCPHVKRHMTRWLFLLTPLTDGSGENGCLW